MFTKLWSARVKFIVGIWLQLKGSQGDYIIPCNRALVKKIPQVVQREIINERWAVRLYLETKHTLETSRSSNTCRYETICSIVRSLRDNSRRDFDKSDDERSWASQLSSCVLESKEAANSISFSCSFRNEMRFYSQRNIYWWWSNGVSAVPMLWRSDVTRPRWKSNIMLRLDMSSIELGVMLAWEHVVLLEEVRKGSLLVRTRTRL